jgi:hypothetical protein
MEVLKAGFPKDVCGKKKQVAFALFRAKPVQKNKNKKINKNNLFMEPNM